MSDPIQQAPEGDNPTGLTAEEQASVAVGQRGFTEPGDVNTPPPSGPQRPEWCPEQFFKDGVVDNEGLAKSYAALRGKMDGKPAEEAPAAAPAAEPKAGPGGKIEAAPEAAPDAAAQPITTAMEAAAAEWETTQELSEDSYSSLEAAGVPRQIVDLYLEGIKATTAQQMAAIHGFVGGEDQYNTMVSWAAKNLSPAEIDAYNGALDNPALRETAVVGLHTKFSRTVPSEGKLVTPNDGSAASSDVFKSRDELVAAQKDPRYATDAGYRAAVADKLGRSQGGGFAAFDRPMFERQIIST